MSIVLVLGSTGSIGTQALDVAAREGIRIRGLAAGGADVGVLARQAAETHAEVVAVARKDAVGDLEEALAACGAAPEILAGPGAAAELASSATPDERVLNGITGAVGLGPTLAALDAGATLVLANKESLVVGGDVVRARQKRPGQVIPVDSEHSAMFQALASGRHHRGMTAPHVDGTSEVRRLILTASGGPFRGRTRAELRDVTPEQALAHPTWSMGPVVTINSSTLMNKGLELIEAHLLFDVPPDDIVATVHPQSIVHSMVEFVDGSTIAQASPPDMRLPIALGMTWPERRYPATPCDWSTTATWTFEPVDDETFPAIRLARAAVAESATHPAVMNAANEVCVAAFLEGRIRYLDIVDTVTRVVESHEGASRGKATLELIERAQQWALREAAAAVAGIEGNR